MFPDKARMVKAANSLWLILAVAPALYLVTGALVALEGGFASDRSFVLVLFFGLVIVSAANVGFTVFLQSRGSKQARSSSDPVGRTFLTVATGSILSEANAVYGLVLTLLSGMIFYGIGFCLVAWASLFWVRERFKQNLRKLPDTQPHSTS